MDPLTLFGIAKGIADITGLSDWLGGLLKPEHKEAVNTVIDIAQAVTGSDRPNQVIDKLKNDPDLLLKTKEQLMAHKESLYRMVLQDKADARALQKAALSQSDPMSKRFIYNFAWFWSVVACLFIFLMLLYPIPQENIRFADTILGFILGTVIATILQFFYGSMLKHDNHS